MARNKNNILVRGFKGKLGNQFILRNRGGQTYLVNIPEKKKDRVPTARQLEMQERFTEAAAYARTALEDPALEDEYAARARPEQNAFNIAFRDFFRPPVLSKLITENYKGLVRDKLQVRAKDDFRVAGVVFIIIAPDGTEIEMGEAVPMGNKLDWIYTATQANPNIVGSTVKVVATDLPKNSTELIKVL